MESGPGNWSGEEWALAHERYSPYIRAIARRMVGDQSAEDACQDVWVRVVTSTAEHGGRATVKTWLHRITVNTCLDILRRRGRVGAEMVTVESEELLASVLTGAPDVLLESASARIDAAAMLRALSQRDRELLQLRYLDGMSDSEVAQHLGEHEEAVKTAVRRARGKLRAQFAFGGFRGAQA